MAGSGGQQLIGGKTYTQYTPEWYAAMDADKIQRAGTAGKAAGTQQAAQISTAAPAISSAMEGLLKASGMGSGSGGDGGGGGGGFPGGSMGGNIPGAPGAPAGPAGVANVDTSAAASAAFGNAKDQVGEETNASLVGLRSALAGRGLLGSGAESRGTTSIITKGQGELGKVSRGQAVEQADLEQKNAETNYQGGIAQRGQDIQRESNVMSAQNEQNRLRLEQSSLQLQQRQQVLAGLQAALGGSVKSY